MDLETILKNNTLLYYKLRDMAIFYFNHYKPVIKS